MRFMLVCLASASAAALLSQDPATTQKQDQPSGSRANSSSSSSSQAGSLANVDRTFIAKAMADGKKQVEMANSAMSMLSDSEVKAFAQRIVDDHTKANQELEGLAQKKGVSPMGRMDRSDKPVSSSTDRPMSDHSMNDRTFIGHAIKDHDNAVSLFEKEARSGSDPEVKAWAEKMLPTLREHSMQAKSLQTRVGKSSNGTPDGKTPSHGTDPAAKQP